MKHLRGARRRRASPTVHLLPVFDFATIPEQRADQASRACDLAALAADSDQQQACVAAIADKDAYNWGYDPLPLHRARRARTPPTRTARRAPSSSGRWSQALNGAGLRVVHGRGLQPHRRRRPGRDTSVLDQVVPGYYQRLLATARSPPPPAAPTPRPSTP